MGVDTPSAASSPPLSDVVTAGERPRRDSNGPLLSAGGGGAEGAAEMSDRFLKAKQMSHLVCVSHGGPVEHVSGRIRAAVMGRYTRAPGTHEK